MFDEYTQVFRGAMAVLVGIGAASIMYFVSVFIAYVISSLRKGKVGPEWLTILLLPAAIVGLAGGLKATHVLPAAVESPVIVSGVGPEWCEGCRWAEDGDDLISAPDGAELVRVRHFERPTWCPYCRITGGGILIDPNYRLWRIGGSGGVGPWWLRSSIWVEGEEGTAFTDVLGQRWSLQEQDIPWDRYGWLPDEGVAAPDGTTWVREPQSNIMLAFGYAFGSEYDFIQLEHYRWNAWGGVECIEESCSAQLNLTGVNRDQFFDVALGCEESSATSLDEFAGEHLGEKCTFVVVNGALETVICGEDVWYCQDSVANHLTSGRYEIGDADQGGRCEPGECFVYFQLDEVWHRRLPLSPTCSEADQDPFQDFALAHRGETCLVVAHGGLLHRIDCGDESWGCGLEE